MNKLWYTTIILAIAVVALGIFFFFVLPRNRPSNGSPIALLDTPPEDDFLSTKGTEKPDARPDIPDEFALPLDSAFQDEDLLPSDSHPQQQLLKKQEFPEYGQETTSPIRTVPSSTPPPPPRATPVSHPVTGRTLTDTHTVVSGEWFAHITNQYWGDFFLWPDLYTLNKMKNHDPDLIYPGELVNIYQSLVDDNILDSDEKKVLLDAYLHVYHTYKELGPQKNQSIWRLLYSATRYEPDFLNIYRDQIEPRDREMAAQLVQESRNID